MFTIHKTDAPLRSGQLSVDSHVNDNSSSVPTSDNWISQCSDDSFNGPMRSPEPNKIVSTSKRTSVFNLRSRSNTATSTSSLISINSPRMAQHESSRSESPFPLSQYSSHNHQEPSGSRRSLFRGKISKRLSESHPSEAATFDQQDFEASGKRTSVLRKSKKREHQLEVSRKSAISPRSHPTLIDTVRGLKDRISSPFDFQHLTHTDRHQFATLEQTSEGSLAAGFRAVRASQQPSSRLTGIRADDLHFTNFSSENLSATDLRSMSVTDIGSPAHSPAMTHGWQGPEPLSQIPASRPGLRLTRSVESFSQPGIKHRGHGHSQSIVGPPRLSSLPKERMDNVYDTAIEANRTSTTRRIRTKRESGVWDSFSLAAVTTEPSLSRVEDTPTYVGHALTTPDDLAIQAITPPFSPGLEDVAEEPEMFVHPRAAPQPPVKTPTSPRSPLFDSYFNIPRSPPSRTRVRGSSYSSSKSPTQKNGSSRPVSQMSETLGSSGLVRRESARRPPAARRQSNTWRVPQESWEDDVDYIYENALEADCDFEWDRTSADGPNTRAHDDLAKTQNSGFTHISQGPQTDRSGFNDDFERPAQHFSQDFRASLLMPNGVPDLEPTSATSASTLETGLATPSDFYGLPSQPSDSFSLSHALLVPQEYKDSKEISYDDLLNQYEEQADSHFTLLEPEYSATSSARSSRVRSSRRSSYDSSFMSSAQSSGLWSSPVRRSASSAGSVPDLIPSRRTRRDFSFSVMIDQLSDSVASLKNLDEERESEDDVTPPGHSLDDRTFFPPGDKMQDDTRQSNDGTLEDQLRTSLQLARCGSQRNERSSTGSQLSPSVDLAEQDLQLAQRRSPRHHKQALSDGAAKLLANVPSSATNSTKSRGRAATTTQSVRSPMLSLFPTPPRNSPTPNRM